MGILNKLKDVTGVGLGAQEQYNRAYEKGVFMQPPDYGAAAKHFLSAFEKFEKEGNLAMAKRAKANSLLYELIQTKSVNLFGPLQEALEGGPEIERIGSNKEMISVEPLLIELRALREATKAEALTTNSAKAEAFRAAGDTIMQLGTRELIFSDLLKLPGPTDKGMSRAFYYLAQADFNMAMSLVNSTPEQAQDFAQKAAVGFRQAKMNQLAEDTDLLVEQIGSRRHCWMCGREMQGKNFFYAYYPAEVTSYHRTMIESLKQDVGMIDQAHSVTLCSICGSAIERQADLYATRRMEELRAWVNPILEAQSSAIADLQARLRRLESLAHRH
jgi:hypothetical protein